MLSLSYENINYVMTQILKLSCASFSYVNISYVLPFEEGGRGAISCRRHKFSGTISIAAKVGKTYTIPKTIKLKLL